MCIGCRETFWFTLLRLASIIHIKCYYFMTALQHYFSFALPIYLMFCELDNVDVLFRLGGLPRIGTLSEPRRQREHGQTKGLMSRTMALHMHHKTLYISQPSFAKQQCGTTTFCVFETTRVPTANCSCFY